MPCFDKELAQRQYRRMTAGCDAKRAAGVRANQLGANRLLEILGEATACRLRARARRAGDFGLAWKDGKGNRRARPWHDRKRL